MRRALPPLLARDTSFRRFWIGQTVSLFGDQITSIALPLTAVLALHADAAEMGYLTTAALVPNLIFSLHAGAWVDRLGRRRDVMLVADATRAILIASIPAAYGLWHVTFAQLYVVAFLTGTASVFFGVAYGALFALTVEREEYVAASSLLNGSRAASFVGGPSVGGVLVQILRGPWALLVDAGTFVWSAFSLGRMRVVEPAGDVEGGDLLTGARWLARSAVMRAELLATATINYFNFVFFTLFILYTTRSLHVAPAALGFVLGAGAAGGLVGSVVTGRLTRRIGVGPALMVGCILFPAPLLLIPAAAGPRWVIYLCLFASEFGSGLGVMILDIAAGAVNAALVPGRLRARVSGAFMVVNYGVRPLGTISGGLLGASLGLRPTLWIATAGACAGILWLMPSPVRTLRELPAVLE